MDKGQKVASLIRKKLKISKEIKDLQKNCKHIKKSLKSIQENEDSSIFVVRWICDECYVIKGIPNNEELNNFLKQ
jgi:hypothetical protein|tara:strand:+ start:493 stop:717 length:225 start_codon:yes stop_codon:yes gene_type:complete